MRTSARNTFSGTATRLTKGAVNSEIELTLAGGERIVAIITNGSVDALGLSLGANATALIKASWVILGKDQKMQGSARATFCPARGPSSGRSHQQPSHPETGWRYASNGDHHECECSLFETAGR
jgi:molybdopterin-binding protein